MHWIDITLVIASIVFVMLFGLKFAHKQDSTNSYFAAGGSLPAWAIGMSIFATLISSVTFLAYPGAAYGGSWILLVQGLMVPIVLVGMIWFIVPLFRKAIKLSTYEYFERRFGFGARLYGSIATRKGNPYGVDARITFHGAAYIESVTLLQLNGIGG